MARTSPVKKARRSLAWLAVIIVALAAFNLAAVLANGGQFTPKLALDLEGGTQIILQPQLASKQTVTTEQLNQAVTIIRQRVDASGVSESEINTQGGGGQENVVVSLPGPASKATIASISTPAKLDFRPVLVTSAATANSAGPSGSPTPGASAPAASTKPGATAPGASTKPGASANPGASATPAPSPSASLSTVPTSKPTNASDLAYITPALEAQYAAFDCKSAAAKKANIAPAGKPLITCDDTGTQKFVLGPVEVKGTSIADATSGVVQSSQGVSTGQWAVNIVFNSKGADEFAKITTRLYAFLNKGPQNQFAIVLDGIVISAPTTNAIITDGKPQISGNFTQTSAKTLADQLKFGALPLSFQQQSVQEISATLGSSQLLSGLLAGLIGLILVVVYSLIQYRLLGLVTVASLLISAIITYLFVTLLSSQQGYRLSLAGVAGLIVAIGITADSFIVYFERIRDELRGGRGLESAVETGWRRALRTILASDTVNLMAAVVLFLLAVGNVRGFALTLGLTTIIDVVVVALFTHPMLQLLATTRFFGEGHRFSGLDPNALGAVYRGRARFREPVLVAGKGSSSSGEAARRQTIAERKAAETESNRTKGKDS